MKKISTLAGIIIIIVVAVVLFGGVFVYQYFVSLKQIQNSNVQPNKCSNLYWFDNLSGCSQTPKQFCGAYMYYGLHTFNSKQECLNGLSIASGRGSVNNSAKSGNFTISVSYVNELGIAEKQSVEIKNISLPVDSQTKACSLITQTDGVWELNKYYQFNCNPEDISDKGNYWEFNIDFVCKPPSDNKPMPPCGGYLSGRINKNNGNIDNSRVEILQ